MTRQILLHNRKTGIYLHELHENRCNKQCTFLKEIYAVTPQSGKFTFVALL